MNEDVQEFHDETILWNQEQDIINSKDIIEQFDRYCLSTKEYDFITMFNSN